MLENLNNENNENMMKSGTQTNNLCPCDKKRKGSKRTYKVDGKVKLTPEAKAEYIATQKTKDYYCKNEYCIYCACNILKASEQEHLHTKKHIKFVQLYEDTKNELLTKNITNEESIMQEFKMRQEKHVITHFLVKYGKKKHLEQFQYLLST
jgi:hypothetical protein